MAWENKELRLSPGLQNEFKLKMKGWKRLWRRTCAEKSKSAGGERVIAAATIDNKQKLPLSTPHLNEKTR